MVRIGGCGRRFQHEENPMSELVKVEYRVKAKTTYFITRYCQFGDGASVSEQGEFRDRLTAHRAAEGLCMAEARFQGISEDDPRLVWPEPLVYGEIKGAAAVDDPAPPSCGTLSRPAKVAL